MRGQRRLPLIRAALGGIAVGAVFALLLRQEFPDDTVASSPPVPIPLGKPLPTPRLEVSEASGTSHALSPVASLQPSTVAAPEVRAERLGVRLTLPSGYRVATALNTYDEDQPGPPRYTVTKSPPAHEEEYVALLNDLRARGVATEAPEFAPGATITLTRLDAPGDEPHAAALAKEQNAVITVRGLAGRRYRRVEGVFTYDAAYFRITESEVLVVSMSYAAGEPAFDNSAYESILNALTPL